MFSIGQFSGRCVYILGGIAALAQSWSAVVLHEVNYRGVTVVCNSAENKRFRNVDKSTNPDTSGFCFAGIRNPAQIWCMDSS